MKDLVVNLLKEKSPRTTAEIANQLDVSWHTAHETLLEMQIEGIVKRIVVSDRHLWFLENDKLLSKINGFSEQLASPEVKMVRFDEKKK